MIRKFLLSAFLLAASSVVFSADKNVSNIKVSAAWPDVDITYDLSADPIITIELYVDSKLVKSPQISGDANKLVKAGAGKKCRWRSRLPRASAESSVSVKIREYSEVNPPPVLVQDLHLSLSCWIDNVYKPFLNYFDSYEYNEYYESFDQVPLGVTNRLYKTSKIAYVRIPAKGVTFKMGSPASEPGRTAGEYEHNVTLTNDFYLAIYPLTQGQARSIIAYSVYLKNGYEMTAADTKSSYGSKDGDDWLLTPIDNMSSFKLINIYSYNSYGGDIYKLEQGLLYNYKLMTGSFVYVPTEAEWEFACRAGRSGPLNADGDIDDIAWHSGNSGGRLQPVGLKKPNDWGLYDMLGNVWECCHDSWRGGLDSTDVTAPLHWKGGRDIVSRGGAFNEDPSCARSASRHSGGGRHVDQGMEGCVGEGVRFKIQIFN